MTGLGLEFGLGLAAWFDWARVRPRVRVRTSWVPGSNGLGLRS